MEVLLQEKWWYIYIWCGVSIDDLYIIICFDWIDCGFYVMVRGIGDIWFIDFYYWNECEIYQVYYKKDYLVLSEFFECYVVDDRKSGIQEVDV